MKKLLLLAVLAVSAASLTACGSMRTPTDSKNKDIVWYNTFFGISIESAVYGDGLIVSPINHD